MARNDQFQVVGQSDQAAIKCPIMKRIQAEPISRVHTIVLIDCPGNDVTRNQQFGHCDSSKAALLVVSSEHC